MKAYAYFGPHDMRMIDKPDPKIEKPDDAIIKVTRSTICGTDVHIEHGVLPHIKPGTIIGHEFAGEVMEVGPAVTHAKKGDKVAVNCITWCGECYHCRRGEVNHCENGGWLFGHLIDGGQAEYLRVPMAKTAMHVIPESLTEEDVLFCGDILSTGFFCATNGNIKPGDIVACMGAGPVGQCAMATARLYGPSKIIAVDVNDFRANKAVEVGVADMCLNPTKVNIPEAIKEITKGRGADVCLEACGGGPETWEQALYSVKKSGNISIVGIFAGPVTFPLDKFLQRNPTIKMGWVHSYNIDQLIKLIDGGKINMKHLITHRAPLNDIVKGYDIFGGKKENCLKWVVTPYQK